MPPLVFVSLISFRPLGTGGKKSIVSYLVSKNADVNQMDFVGLTPLDTAALRGNAVAAAELLRCEGILKEVHVIINTMEWNGRPSW